MIIQQFSSPPVTVDVIVGAANRQRLCWYTRWLHLRILISSVGDGSTKELPNR